LEIVEKEELGGPTSILICTKAIAGLDVRN
jgi:hypothetical protein